VLLFLRISFLSDSVSAYVIKAITDKTVYTSPNIELKKFINPTDKNNKSATKKKRKKDTFLR
jgi:hypothetical protein